MGRTVTPLLRLRRFESCSPHIYKKIKKIFVGLRNSSYICKVKITNNKKCGSSSVGRASAFQAECRGFDPRLPLTEITIKRDCDFFISRYSSAVERFLGKEEVSGSSPDNGSIK